MLTLAERTLAGSRTLMEFMARLTDDRPAGATADDAPLRKTSEGEGFCGLCDGGNSPRFEVRLRQPDRRRVFAVVQPVEFENADDALRPRGLPEHRSGGIRVRFIQRRDVSLADILQYDWPFSCLRIPEPFLAPLMLDGDKNIFEALSPSIAHSYLAIELRRENYSPYDGLYPDASACWPQFWRRSHLYLRRSPPVTVLNAAADSCGSGGIPGANWRLQRARYERARGMIPSLSVGFKPPFMRQDKLCSRPRDRRNALYDLLRRQVSTSAHCMELGMAVLAGKKFTVWRRIQGITRYHLPG